MNFRNTLILLVLSVAIGAFIYFYEIKGGEKREKVKEAESKLLTFTKDSVSAIVLKPDNIELKKIGITWEIISPIKSLADESSVNGLLNAVESAKRDRAAITTSAAEHATYGLAPARHQIVLNHESKQDTIYLGDNNTTSTQVFARVNDDPEVILTGVNLANQAKKPLFEWRNKDILTFESSAVNRVLLKTPTARFDLKKESGKWQLVSPIKGAADESKITQMINRIRNGRISEFVTEQMHDPSQYGLDRPGYEFTVTYGANDAEKTVQFGKKEGASYLAHDPARPVVFKVDTSIVHDLQVKLMDLRNKKLAEFESWNADYVELNYADTLKIVCEKDTAGTWQIVAPEKRTAKSWKVSNLTSNLSGLQAVEFIEEHANDLKPYGLDRPRLTAIAKEKGTEVARVLIGREKGQNTFAKSANNPLVVLVKKEEAERLMVKLNDLAEEN